MTALRGKYNSSSNFLDWLIYKLTRMKPLCLLCVKELVDRAGAAVER